MKAYSYFLNLPWYKVDHSYIMRVIYNDANTFISNGIMQYLNLFKIFYF